MDLLDRVVPPRAFRMSTAITVIVSGWLALTFLFTVGSALAGA